ncbi:DUF4031 domain-containing protein [Thiothrix eikelboomii]|uniref:DUF4031 domain-containing protein n=1 Tax=Thiothrix eikelboomii TaxID=92487 RepID=UPI003BAE219F
MAVYVDDSKIKWNGMIMCHLIADDIVELHSLAISIGLEVNWFQNKKYPHYDISLEKKKMAIKKGAIEIAKKDAIKMLNGQQFNIQLNLF